MLKLQILINIIFFHWSASKYVPASPQNDLELHPHEKILAPMYAQNVRISRLLQDFKEFMKKIENNSEENAHEAMVRFSNFQTATNFPRRALYYPKFDFTSSTKVGFPDFG